MKDKGYINIQGWMINELDLKGNELILFAVIHGFSQDGKSKYRGSLSYIEQALKISRRTVVRTLESLLEKKLITKELNQTGNLYSVKMSLLDQKVVSKCHGGSDKSTPVGSVKSIHNNNKYNNKDNNNTSNEVAMVIKLFEKLDVKNKTYYRNKTQRAKAQFLLDEYGYDKVAELIDVYLQFKDERFLPSISNPHEMVEKWSKLGDFFRRKQSEKNELAKRWIL